MSHHTSRSLVASDPHLNARLSDAVREIGTALPQISRLGNRDRHYALLDADFERMALFAHSFDAMRVIAQTKGRETALCMALRLPLAWELSLRAAIGDPVLPIGEAYVRETAAEGVANDNQAAAVLGPCAVQMRRAIQTTIAHRNAADALIRAFDREVHTDRPIRLADR